MTREQLLGVAKPIAFSTEMVRAILNGRKSVTRRLMKPQPVLDDGMMWHWKDCQWMDGGLGFPASGIEDYAPRKTGDILYVRETWCECATIDSWLTDTALYGYRTDYIGQDTPWEWRSSRHMPKAAARLFLRVADVRVEQLQDITPEQCVAEGVEREALAAGEFARGIFSSIWDGLRDKQGLPLLGWAANPWVWVIGFERIAPS